MLSDNDPKATDNCYIFLLGFNTLVLHLKQPGRCCRHNEDTEEGRILLDVRPDEPEPHQGYSFEFGLPNAPYGSCTSDWNVEALENAFAQFQPLSSPSQNFQSDRMDPQ